MAEAFAIVGVVASIVQLVDFSSRVLDRVNEFHSNLDEVPASFQHIKTDLPLLATTLREIKSAICAGHVTDDTQKALGPVVEGCQTQISSLDDVLLRTLPTPGESRIQRTKKAIASLKQDGKVEKIQSALHWHMQSLTFYYSVISSTRQPLTGMLI
jgi:hypothetical protein